jgi:hypothetical protein
MGTDDIVGGGYERTGEKQSDSKIEVAKGFIKEIWASKPIKVITFCLAGAALIYVGGKLFYLLGDSVKGYRYFKESWKGTIAPPVTK